MTYYARVVRGGADRVTDALDRLVRADEEVALCGTCGKLDKFKEIKRLKTRRGWGRG